MSELIDITPEDSVTPIYRTELTPEQIAENEAWAAENLRQEAEIAAREAIHQSALAKLQKLGLTEDEAKAIVGV